MKNYETATVDEKRKYVQSLVDTPPVGPMTNEDACVLLEALRDQTFWNAANDEIKDLQKRLDLCIGLNNEHIDKITELEEKLQVDRQFAAVAGGDVRSLRIRYDEAIKEVETLRQSVDRTYHEHSQTRDRIRTILYNSNTFDERRSHQAFGRILEVVQ